MINNFIAPANAIREIEEENIDIASYQIESGLDDLFSMMQHLRHNDPELFNQNLIRWKETEARVLEMGSRIKSMQKMVKITEIINGGNYE